MNLQLEHAVVGLLEGDFHRVRTRLEVAIARLEMNSGPRLKEQRHAQEIEGARPHRLGQAEINMILGPIRSSNQNDTGCRGIKKNIRNSGRNECLYCRL